MTTASGWAASNDRRRSDGRDGDAVDEHRAADEHLARRVHRDDVAIGDDQLHRSVDGTVRVADRVNPMIFVDFPCTDPEAMSNFYAELFGWTFNRRPAGEFHEVLPGVKPNLGIHRSRRR